MTQSGSRWTGTKTEDADRQKWRTPDYLFKWLSDLYGPFTIDCAASEQNTMCERYFTEEMNALKQIVNFGEMCFLNPPFNNIKPFIEWVMWQRDNLRATFAVVLPSDLSTQWGELVTRQASEIIHITGGRVNYVHNMSGKEIKGNNKPTIIAVFRPDDRSASTRYYPLRKIKART